MRQVWSEVNKRRLWRAIWVTLAEVQSEFGVVSAEQVADLRAQMDQVDIPRAFAIEEQIICFNGVCITALLSIVLQFFMPVFLSRPACRLN